MEDRYAIGSFGSRTLVILGAATRVPGTLERLFQAMLVIAVTATVLVGATPSSTLSTATTHPQYRLSHGRLCTLDF